MCLVHWKKVYEKAFNRFYLRKKYTIVDYESSRNVQRKYEDDNFDHNSFYVLHTLNACKILWYVSLIYHKEIDDHKILKTRLKNLMNLTGNYHQYFTKTRTNK